jgi:hypothetical protein
MMDTSLLCSSLQQEAAKEKTSSDRLVELAHISTELAQFVAKNPCAPPDLLRELSNSSDATICQNVAANPNTPTEVLLKLGSKFPQQLLDNPIFSLLWLENPNLVNEMPISTLISLLKLENVPVSLLEQAVNRGYDTSAVLLDDVFNERTSAPKLKARLGMALAMNAQTPRTVLEQLIKDWGRTVKEAARLHVNWAGEMTRGWNKAVCKAIRMTALEYNERENIRNLANRGLIPASIIQQLLKHKDMRLLIAAIPQNPLNSPERLAQNQKYNDAPKSITCNLNIPVELLEELAQDKDSDIRELVAQNPNTPVNLLEQLAQDRNESVRKSVANNPNIPIKLLEQLAQYKNELIRKSIVNNPNTPIQLLELLAQDENYGVRIYVANNLNTPVQLLELLAQDGNKWVRRGVASNPNTPRKLLNQLLKQLAQDENRHLREFVAGHPQTPVNLLLEVMLKFCPPDSTPCLSRFLVLLHSQAPYQALAKYYCSEVWLNRYAIAQNPNTPIDTLKALVKDANRIVRAAAKANVQRRESTQTQNLESHDSCCSQNLPQ